MNIDEIRKKYPQYDDISDSELADKLYSKFIRYGYEVSALSILYG